MALRIRLARGGAKKRPFYRIIVADARAPRDGRFIEKLGIYNPLLTAGDDARLRMDAARAKFWLDRGASASNRVAGFLAKEGLLESSVRNNPIKGQPGKKAQTRLEERAQKQAEEAKAAAEAEEAQTAASETPADAPASAAEPQDDKPAAALDDGAETDSAPTKDDDAGA